MTKAVTKSAIKSVLIAATLFGTGSAALAASSANIKGTAVKLRALDKVTARTFDYTVELGETLEFGSLTIHARHCEVAPPTELPETYAFLQIDDRRLDADAQDDGAVERIFSGWMFKSRPAISALDHRVYDVWVIGCETPAPTIEGLRDTRDYRPDRL